MWSRVKTWVYRQRFCPSALGGIITPFYFARRGLYLSIKRLVEHITGAVLDVGCGSKPYQHLFGANTYIGMEIQRTAKQGSMKADVLYDGKVFPFRTEYFDSVLCSQVLEHVFEPNAFLKEIYRVLKPGGSLLLTTPFVWDEHEQPADYARYTSYGLHYLLKTNGFRIIEQCKTISDGRCFFQLANGVIYKKIMPLSKSVRFAFSAIFPLVNLLGSLIGRLLPRNQDLYLDNVILARKGVEYGT